MLGRKRETQCYGSDRRRTHAVCARRGAEPVGVKGTRPHWATIRQKSNSNGCLRYRQPIVALPRGAVGDDVGQMFGVRSALVRSGPEATRVVPSAPQTRPVTRALPCGLYSASRFSRLARLPPGWWGSALQKLHPRLFIVAGCQASLLESASPGHRATILCVLASKSGRGC